MKLNLPSKEELQTKLTEWVEDLWHPKSDHE